MRNFLTAILIFALCRIRHCSNQQHRAKPRREDRRRQTSGCIHPRHPQPVQAIFQTTMGNITCTLFPDKAPVTVANFIGLATGHKGLEEPCQRRHHAQPAAV